uniref:Mediator complex subunit 17 n=1 Tax=Globodera pallida TaxID=36090 RepID=A0A183CQL8_GLOPA
MIERKNVVNGNESVIYFTKEKLAMFGGQTSANGSGIQICVEPLNEWKIQEIGYDGVEKYTKPLAFKDLLRKNARNIDWSKIIGEEAIFDTAIKKRDSEDQLDETSNELAQPSKSLVEPVAGPWALVAKHLHYSLQEVNVMLDCMRIARTDYLNTLVTALVQDERAEAEQVAASKAFHLHTRRRVLNETSKDIERMATARLGVVSVGSDKSDFFNELRELRENWRIRKVGPNIFGDLGYKTFAPKFSPHEVFDVTQKSASNRRESTIRFSNKSFIELRLPQHLRCRTELLVFIET